MAYAINRISRSDKWLFLASEGLAMKELMENPRSLRNKVLTCLSFNEIITNSY